MDQRDVRHHRRIFVDQVHAQHFEQRCVGIGETRLELFRIIDVSIGQVGWVIPHVVLAETNLLAADVDVPDAQALGEYMRALFPAETRNWLARGLASLQN